MGEAEMPSSHARFGGQFGGAAAERQARNAREGSLNPHLVEPKRTETKAQRLHDCLACSEPCRE